MFLQNEFPKPVKDVLDVALKVITSKLPHDLWDEATEYLIIGLKECAEKKQEYHGLRYLADIEEDIENMKDAHIYTIVKRKEPQLCLNH